MRRIWQVSRWLLPLLLGCRGCFGDGALAVGGEHPYVRCLAADPPASGTRKVGALSLRIEKRELRIDGLHYPITFAAFSGPAFGAAPGAAELAALRAAKPDLALLLGDVGDDAATARATLTALASLPLPTLVVAGGRDTRERIAKAVAAIPVHAERIIDVTAVRTVRIAHDTLVPVAGALDGHYVLSSDACGYARSDLQKLARELTASDSRRWLVGWQAPTGSGRFSVARTQEGLDLGSAPLAELSTHIQASGGLFAWPHVQAMRPSTSGGTRQPAFGATGIDLQLVVARLAGTALERSDGSRVAAGFALLRLDEHGLQLLDPDGVHQ